MRDITLNSQILRLKDFPAQTTKVMILFDGRGWAIRCYDDTPNGNKITTMVPDWHNNLPEEEVVLVRRETL